MVFLSSNDPHPRFSLPFSSQSVSLCISLHCLHHMYQESPMYVQNNKILSLFLLKKGVQLELLNFTLWQHSVFYSLGAFLIWMGLL